MQVATPFHWRYGYNISCADNVVIGPDCQLLDSGRISIGENTRIGARVLITTRLVNKQSDQSELIELIDL
jgi:acetyltransferase-like isoleucine patch superfamily enzyme